MEFTDYPFANKILAMADAERRHPHCTLMWLDSDQIILEDLLEFGDASTVQFAARPVGLAGDGVASLEPSPNGIYWKGLYALCNVRQQSTVTTTIDRKVIVSYYKGGLFITNSHTGLMTAWEDNFRRVWKSSLRPASGDYFVEQSVLAATVSARCDNVRILPDTYNVPIHLLGASATGLQLSGPVVSIHYHHAFDGRNFMELLRTSSHLIPDDRMEWIVKSIREPKPSVGSRWVSRLIARSRRAG